MPDEPYAYMTWRCSECGSEPLEKNNGTLVCETCGHTYQPDSMDHAARVPDPDED